MAKRWYAVHVYSGFEEKVKAHLEQQLTAKGLSESVDEILIPMENVVEFKKGKKEISQRNFFPG